MDMDNVFSKPYLLSFCSSFKLGSSGTNASNAYFSRAFLISIAFCASLVPLLASLFRVIEPVELSDSGEAGLELLGEVF